MVVLLGVPDCNFECGPLITQELVTYFIYYFSLSTKSTQAKKRSYNFNKQLFLAALWWLFCGCVPNSVADAYDLPNNTFAWASALMKEGCPSWRVERVVSVEIVLVQSRVDDYTPWTKSHEKRKGFTFWITGESKKRLNYMKFKCHCPRVRLHWSTATPFVYAFPVAALGRPQKPG